MARLRLSDGKEVYIDTRGRVASQTDLSGKSTVNDYASKTGVMYAYSALTGRQVGKLEIGVPGVEFRLGLFFARVELRAD